MMVRSEEDLQSILCGISTISLMCEKFIIFTFQMKFTNFEQNLFDLWFCENSNHLKNLLTNFLVKEREVITQKKIVVCNKKLSVRLSKSITLFRLFLFSFIVASHKFLSLSLSHSLTHSFTPHEMWAFFFLIQIAQLPTLNTYLKSGL
jgi:hypothetical protein